MEETTWSFPLDDYKEAVAVLEAIGDEFRILGKRIRVAMTEYLQTLPQKIHSQMKKFGSFLTDAFQVESLEDYVQASAIFGQELAKALYQLRLQFAGLKIAVIQAAAPIVQVLLPVLQFAVRMLTGLAQALGYVFRMLFLGTTETQDYTAGVESATNANNAFRRSLAGFDQINRLGGSTESGFSGGMWDAESIAPLGGVWKELAERLAQLLKPLRELDFGPAAESLERLRKALEPITRALFAGLEWAWENIFLPLAEWTVEDLLPEFLDTLAVALDTLAVVIEELKPCFTWLWENFLKPWAEWKADQIIQDLQGIQDGLTGVSDWASTNQSFMEGAVTTCETLMQTLAGIAQESMGVSDATGLATGGLKVFLNQILLGDSPLRDMSSSTGVLSQVVGGLSEAFGSVTGASDGAWESLKYLANHGWSTLKNKFIDPMESGLEGSGNGTIGTINGVLRGAEKAVNFLVSAMNSIRFTIPSWVPVLGGKTFGFNLKPITAPSIPALAKGAVLPANKPFLALVGDQKHGTNVEAPLSTIQEAVANVMDDYNAGNMAGHQATVAVLQELLEAVLGIAIGDDVIANAVSRYDRKMAVVRGG